MIGKIENELKIWANKTKLYQFYNLLSKAHCLAVDDSPLIVPKLGSIKGEPNNRLLTLGWKRKRVIFTEESLLGTKIIKNELHLRDSTGKPRILRLYVLNNLLAGSKKAPKVSRTFIEEEDAYNGFSDF
jgi:hypothetical protein